MGPRQEEKGPEIRRPKPTLAGQREAAEAIVAEVAEEATVREGRLQLRRMEFAEVRAPTHTRRAVPASPGRLRPTRMAASLPGQTLRLANVHSRSTA